MYNHVWLGSMGEKRAKFKVAPGEAVGMLAAQSVCEPATQLLLKAFHAAGVESGLAVSGIDRLIHTLDMRKSSIYTKPIINAYMEDGIEAARNAITRELSSIFSDNRITIDNRHLLLIADIMTWSGKIEGVNAQGIMRRRSVFARAANSAANKHLSEAAIYGYVDNISGIAESIMIGKRIHLGTGSVKLTTDKESEMLRSTLLPTIEEPEFSETEEGKSVYATISMKVGKNLGSRAPERLPAYQHLKWWTKTKKTFNIYKPEYLNTERNFYNAHPDLRLVCGRLAVPEGIREEIALLYRKCIDTGITNGRSTYGMALAVVSITFEEHGIKRDIDGIMKELHIKASYVNSCVEAIKSKLFNKGRRHEKMRQALTKSLEIIDATEKLKQETALMIEEVISRGLYSKKRPEIASIIILDAACRTNGISYDTNKLAVGLGVSRKSIRRAVLQ